MLLQSLTLLLGKENLDFNRYPSFPTLLVTLWSRNFPRIHLEDSHFLPWKKGFQVFVWYCLHCLQEGTWRDLKLLGHDSFNKRITALQTYCTQFRLSESFWEIYWSFLLKIIQNVSTLLLLLERDSSFDIVQIKYAGLSPPIRENYL